MANYYTPWTWSDTHQRHYSYLMSEDHRVIDTLWSGPIESSVSRSNSTAPSPYSATVQNQANDEDGRGQHTLHRADSGIPSSVAYGAATSNEYIAQASSAQSEDTRKRKLLVSLPPDVRDTLGHLERRFIQTGPDTHEWETLDTRYRRVASTHQQFFFVPGRVFKMLWTEPAGQVNPGKTRNSTHFSTVWLNEQAFSEIRYFVVVRNKGTFSQCIPIQTYNGRGVAKPGLIMSDHGMIHTTKEAPIPLAGEYLTKYSIRVEPTATEVLDSASRVNYGKAYAVEHRVKVLDIGLVVKEHRYLIGVYFDSAMRGQ